MRIRIMLPDVLSTRTFTLTVGSFTSNSGPSSYQNWLVSSNSGCAA
jgi:hypothetical protein